MPPDAKPSNGACTHNIRVRCASSGRWHCAVCASVVCEPVTDADQAIGEFFCDVAPSVAFVYFIGFMLLAAALTAIGIFCTR